MEPPVQIGQVIAQKYRVDQFIGRGGMGVVVAAFYLELDQPVAIKFLLSESGLQGEGAERFRREARAAARIHSEHVARVFDVGLLDGRVPYMVMELLHGHDLEQEIERSGPLPLGDAASYLLQAIDAVAEAHSVGIVHRDLKPTNLFLAQRADGSRIVKVLDFGISKSLGRDVALTRTSAFVGSPLYMAPEQMRSARDVDARADIWSLGAILYVMLTGQLPHPGASLPEVCVAVMNSSPRPLKEFLPNVPDRLEAILTRCLAKDPAQRYASVAELAEQLLPFAPGLQLVVERAVRLLHGVVHPVSSLPFVSSSVTPSASTPPAQRISGTPSSSHPSPPGATEAPWAKAGRKGAGRRRAPWLLGTLLGVSAALGLVLWLTRAKVTPTTLADSPSAAVAAGASIEAEPPAAVVPSVVPAPAAVSPPGPEPSSSALAPAPSGSPRSSQRGPATAARPYTYFGGRR